MTDDLTLHIDEWKHDAKDIVGGGDDHVVAWWRDGVRLAAGHLFDAAARSAPGHAP